MIVALGSLLMLLKGSVMKKVCYVSEFILSLLFSYKQKVKTGVSKGLQVLDQIQASLAKLFQYLV